MQIYTEMEKLGWSVTRLAKKAKVPQSTASQLFARGSGHPDTIRKLANAVSIELDQIVIPEPPKQTRKSA